MLRWSFLLSFFNNKAERRDWLVSLFFALILCANALCKPLPLQNAMLYVVGLSIVAIVFLTKARTIRRINRKQIALALLLLLFFFFSIIIAPPYGKVLVMRYFRFFLLCGIGILLIANYSYNFDKVCMCVIVVSLAYAPYALTHDFGREYAYEVLNDEWMGYIYAIMPIIISSIYYIFAGEYKIIKALSIVCLVLYFPLFIFHSARGGYVALFVAFLIFFVHYLYKRRVNKTLIFSICAILVICGVFLSDYLLASFESFALNNSIRSISKFFTSEDVSNGRFTIYNEALRDFMNSPIWGNGIASFRNYVIYPHNLFLQFIEEGGLLMTIPLIIPIIQAFVTVFTLKERSFDYRLTAIFILTSVIELNFSGCFWEKQRFWLLIWTTLGSFYLNKNQVQTNRK